MATCTGTIGYPDEHAIAVAECSLLIADQLAVAPDVRQNDRQGRASCTMSGNSASMTDPASPGPLTPSERRKIEQHPVEGEQIIAGSVDPGVAQVVRDHHERWDGSGIRPRLAGAQIPLAARVVAVADAYLAMREERPYRKRIDKDAAMRELSKCAGSQFDPACVQALMRAV